MKTYTVRGRTFTEEQLKGENPYINPDGSMPSAAEDYDAFQHCVAFDEAQVEYELDNMPEEEREKKIRMYEHMADKMRMS
jgi:hypothetical protein